MEKERLKRSMLEEEFGGFQCMDKEFQDELQNALKKAIESEDFEFCSEIQKFIENYEDSKNIKTEINTPVESEVTEMDRQFVKEMMELMKKSEELKNRAKNYFDKKK